MELLTVQEIARILKAKPKTVYQWAELGQIPCVKLNGCLRFDLEDVLRWVRSCKRDAGSGYNPLTQARGPRKGGD